ncbi:class I SAM-dependent methyltransferase [Ignisphaera sp. 4213-co]|uniref:Class I SAM-dependent methyltransferase n=1 Tax=Ignisphaera cupida TaxID=3050454 RepID=A0ABD4Z4G2_9CREN|nr:class I SAM-dependent methyltransferase [Ignisphaera sp. 4213-co]MDK6028014.1 class I SAM-dependent methyltransferase [Ignisphaera sp. 4213-co]
MSLVSAYYEGARVPWVPTREELLDIVMRLANVKSEDVFYDLGCGDGRVVLKAVKEGVKKAVCVEINPMLIERAKENAKSLNVLNKIEFVNEDFFKTNLSEASVVYMYLLTSVNKALRPKLEAELKDGARVVTLDFEIPGWRPIQIVEVALPMRTARLYLYVKGISDK